MKQMRLTKRGKIVKAVAETIGAGVIGGAFGYMLILTWFG